MVCALVAAQLAACSSSDERSEFTLAIPPLHMLEVGASNAFALAPDGSEIVYSATAEDGVRRLYRRQLQQSESEPILGTEDASSPFFSPNGRWLGFIVDGRLNKIGLDGGLAELVCECDARAASWGPNDRIVFGSASGLSRVSSNGGDAEVLTAPGPGGAAHQRPSFSPSGDGVLFDIEGGGLGILNAETKQWRRIIGQGRGARLLEPAHLVFQRGSSLLAVAFDSKALRVESEPMVVLDGVSTGSMSGPAQFDIASNGTLVYVPGALTIDAPRRLMSVDDTGTALPLIENEAAFAYPRFSPDGQMLAVMIREGSEAVVPTLSGGADVWVLEFATNTLRRLTFDGRSFFPTWSPDGSLIAFVTTREGSFELFVRAADGTGEALPILSSETYVEPTGWARDGTRIFLNQLNRETGWDMVTLRLPDLELEPLVTTDADERAAEPSHAGRGVAFNSGSTLFHVVFTPGYANGPRVRITSGAAIEPSWGRESEWLYFRDPRAFMRLRLHRDRVFPITPESLFPDHFERLPGGYRNYAVSPDSGRFIFVQGPDDGVPRRFEVVRDWSGDLKR